ncbi:translocon-associated protein subunit delta [Eublepharis macularius]|uniref:Translocon-associated protein subunit delta n=1 Tax=Eublepharis macularius TaxID=481883 RepID=A0AA97KPK2_EUBMA|nr:translocon-associated protein subunit delta [Eublepharis macularius]
MEAKYAKAASSFAGRKGGIEAVAANKSATLAVVFIHLCLKDGALSARAPQHPGGNDRSSVRGPLVAGEEPCCACVGRRKATCSSGALPRHVARGAIRLAGARGPPSRRVATRQPFLSAAAMAGAGVGPAGLAALLLLALLSGARAETCTEPAISPSYYTTSDAVISSETVFVVEISLTCKNGAQNVALYADVNGKQFPVTRGQDVGRYQVSWSMEHKLARSGTYEVKFFDEESYSILRKAQRNNEDISGIKPLFTVNVDHRGAWNGPWVSTEVLAACIGLLVYYMAFSAKSNIQA